jgi:predicted N-acyltransferase
MRAEILPTLRDAAEDGWDACANPSPEFYNPFLSYAFLSALEESGCADARTGWAPCHFVLRGGDGILFAAMPCYLKSHSYGEYVFDHAWASAYERAGRWYYPKLQTAVPFTPVTGRRLLVRPGISEGRAATALLERAKELVQRQRASSWHVTFATEAEWRGLASQGFLQRTDTQYHWLNQGFASFEAFLGALSSRKRKTIRRERSVAMAPGIGIEWLTGAEITEAHWDAFFTFYMDTGGRKWGAPYLNRRFFSLIGARMADRILLVMAKRAGNYIAGALNFIGGDTLYGRYWGCLETHDFLHFEVCYYQAIDFAIARKLARVEAGAQGEHKLARGYLPSPTYSLHYFADPMLASAVACYLDEERRAVANERQMLAELAPFKKCD